MVDPSVATSVAAKKSGLSEEQQALAAKAKALGPKAIYANGNVVDLTDLPAAKAQWKGIEDAAIKAGKYEGKDLNTIEGKSSMMYDKLRTDGLDHFQAARQVKQHLAQ